MSPQTNGICERFHKTILQEFYQVTLRKKIYETIDDLQNDLDEWLQHYNNERTHQGKMCCGRTPIQTLADGKRLWKEKFDLTDTSEKPATVRSSLSYYITEHFNHILLFICGIHGSIP